MAAPRWALLAALLSTLCLADKDCYVPPDARHFDIRLSKTEVPAEPTQYACQQHYIPKELWNDDYHAVAFQPLIDNNEVMHHMILFGCDADVPSSEPHACGGMEDKCKSFMNVWTTGLEGTICTYRNTGVLFGRSASKTLLLQIHWSNAGKKSGMTDATGLRIFYTSKLRPYNLGNVQFGQNDLQIPPHVQDYAQSGNCSNHCTSSILREPVYLTRTYIHMHYLGSRGLLQLFRNGRLVSNISEASSYSYDRPPIDVHQKAVQILPGDEVKLTCWFDTKSKDRERNHIVYWGEGSEAEMCYAFVSYFPKTPGFDQCVQFDNYDQCDNYNSGQLIMGSCDYMEFWQTINGVIGLARQQCTSVSATQCTSECAGAIRQIYGHICMKDRLEAFVKTRFLKMVNWEELDQWRTLLGKHCS